MAIEVNERCRQMERAGNIYKNINKTKTKENFHSKRKLLYVIKIERKGVRCTCLYRRYLVSNLSMTHFPSATILR